MRTRALVQLVGLAIIASSGQSRAQTSLPDVVGIRPGISAQEAYNLLKARAPRAQIGVGQFAVAGVTDKPVPTSIAVSNPDVDPPEIIKVWLTMPPSKQVVWAIGRQIEYEQNKQALKSTIINGLRQKYGPETDPQSHYWAFDEQGRPGDSASLRSANCAGRGDWNIPVSPPDGATYTSFTPLLYTPGPPNPCNSLVEIKAQLDSPLGPEYVLRATVILSDLALARRSQGAYQAFLANADAAKKKAELEKAKQQKGPTF
jgi:hypothetical protein